MFPDKVWLTADKPFDQEVKAMCEQLLWIESACTTHSPSKHPSAEHGTSATVLLSNQDWNKEALLVVLYTAVAASYGKNHTDPCTSVGNTGDLKTNMGFLTQR